MTEKRYVVGIDTHKDTIAVALCDPLGAEVACEEFPTTKEGYERTASFIGPADSVIAVGIEGCSSYGSGICRHLLAQGYEVKEVLRPKRPPRRPGETKNDAADAIRAARDALAGVGVYAPKSQDGFVERIRSLLVAREALVKTNTRLSNAAGSLLLSASERLRGELGGLSGSALMEEAAHLRERADETDDALVASLRALARSYRVNAEASEELKARIEKEVRDNAPSLLEHEGVGPITAAELLRAVGDNPDRLEDDAAFSSLCGASPVEASSGRNSHHRLNRGGDRRANCALYMIVLVRMRNDERTQRYVAKRMSEGKSKRDAIRCLKRYVAREMYKAIIDAFKGLPVRRAA